MKDIDLYRTLFEHTGTALVILENDMTISLVNNEFTRLAGATRTEIAGKTWLEFVVEEDRARLITYHRQRRINPVLAPRTYEFQFQDHHSCIKDVVVTVTLLPATGQSIVSLADITKHKQTEEVLRSAHQQLEAIIEFLPDATFVIDNAKWVIAWNRAMEKMTGVKKEDVIGKGNQAYAVSFYGKPRKMLIDLVTLPAPVLDREYQSVERKGRTLFVEGFAPAAYQGQGAYLWGTASALYDNAGNRIGAIESIRDITERKQIEQNMARLERLNLVGEMAAGIGHELRNPMTTVKGYLQLFARKPKFKSYTPQFSLMIEELDRANAIITEFLSLAKNKSVDKKVHNLNDIITALLPLIQADAIVSDKYITTQLANVPAFSLDEKEIRQLLLNLVRNGLEAMATGGVLGIATLYEDQAVVLSIKDQGKGIDPQYLDKLGTPFFTTKDEGTGLGLAICYSIAARHNASIEVDTSPAGTTFFIRFRTET
ncbi:MAG: PAS domain S-box protein [Heliobacteriaceae bacterium]|nr:PAS domain S-box protein [Heliobacteriaceae bacterium]